VLTVLLSEAVTSEVSVLILVLVEILDVVDVEVADRVRTIVIKVVSTTVAVTEWPSHVLERCWVRKRSK
jgi:hypothetical protein